MPFNGQLWVREQLDEDEEGSSEPPSNRLSKYVAVVYISGSHTLMCT